MQWRPSAATGAAAWAETWIVSLDCTSVCTVQLYYSYSCIHDVSYDELEVLITAAQKEINI